MTLLIGRTAQTPLGYLWVALWQDSLAAVSWEGPESQFRENLARRFKESPRRDDSFLIPVARQIEEYLHGRRREFEIPIAWHILPEFQRAALQATARIPYGETRTYGEIAKEIGRPRAARAVGRAEATNPMPLVIPCHRVLGAGKKLIGYSGRNGIQTKAWLLKLEGVTLA